MEYTTMQAIIDTKPEANRVMSSHELIVSADARLTEEAEEAIRRVIEHESREVGDSYRISKFEELAQAEAAEREVQSRLEEVRLHLSDAEDELKQTVPGSWTSAVIFSTCAVACFGAEFILTWATLPFILNVKQYSVLGVALGLAPATALVILDVVIARLFEHPWQAVRSAMQTSHLKRGLMFAIMTVFLIIVGWGNIHTVVLLADAREEAAKARHALEWGDAETVVSVDANVLKQAILWVSVCVTIDGALFLLFGLPEARNLHQRRQARSKVTSLRARRGRLESDHLQAEARAKVCQKVWDEIEAQAQRVAARHQQERLFELEQLKTRQCLNRTSLTIVDGILAASHVGQNATSSRNGVNRHREVVAPLSLEN